MSKKIVNLGKVKARTKELRLNDTVIEHKYDDEQEWQPLVDLGEAGSSIDTVTGYSELPTDAKENDVAIVEEEEYLRTENKTTVLPIEVKINTEDQYIPNIYSINFKDKFGTLLDNEELKSMGAYAISTSLEFEYKYIQYMDISPELASAMIGVNHPVIMVMQSESDSENMNLYLEGVSARDFAIMQMELELEEEQWETLLGEHANDSSADNPSYGWIQLLTSNEPINENSVDLYGAGIYATVIFNAEAPKFNDMLGYIAVSTLDANGNDLIYASASMYGNYDSYDDYDPEETAFAIKYANLTLNNIAHGGMFEQNKDIYNPKGLFQNDNGEWVSLEEKMNTPRFVDTYADLPKTSIENGIMAVAHESVYRSEPELTTKLESFKKYKLNSVGDMTTEIFNNIIEEILPGYPTIGSIETSLWLGNNTGDIDMTISLMRIPYSETESVCGIMLHTQNYETRRGKMALYIIEIPLDYEFESPFPPEQGSYEPLEFSPEVGKWYWCDVVNDKDYYSVGGIHEGFPTDLPDELLCGYGEIYWDEEIYPVAVSEVSTYGDDPNNYKSITSIDLKVFNFEDLSSSVTITYPAGFYRYNNNEWKHVEEVSGGNFDNEDALRALTTEDIGNIQENTEKRHEHSNQYYLDQIQWDTIDKINQNTQLRHTHNNQSYLDQIDYYKMDEINQSINQRHTHSNKSYLDQIDYNTISRIGEISYNTSARHTHGNKSTLDKITESHLSDITSNTNARHTHSNKTYLDQIDYNKMSEISLNTSARHVHTNKSVLDNITGDTFANITLNTNARHTHDNKSTLDKITETMLHQHNNKTYLDQIDYSKMNEISSNTNARHTHSNKSTLDKITETILSDINSNTSSRHEHFNQEALDNLFLPTQYNKTIEPCFYNNGQKRVFNLDAILEFVTDEEISNGIELVKDTVKYVNSDVSEINVTQIAEGESWISFIVNETTKLTIKGGKYFAWINGILPIINARGESYRIYIKFLKYKGESTYGCVADWFVSTETLSYSSPFIDNRLLPTNVNCNFAKIIDNEVVFAPIFIQDGQNSIYNDEEKYLAQGYKRVVGENPHSLTTKLKANDECELVFKEYDNYIIVFWIVTPKGYRMGDYINSSAITDWSYYFRNYDGEDIKDLLIGELDTSNGTNFNETFQDCTSLKILPMIDLSKAENCRHIFCGCSSLVTIKKIICNSLPISIMQEAFLYSRNIENITIEGTIKVNFNNSTLSSCPNLTVDSLMSFINAFEDNTGKETQYTITIGATNLAKLSAEQIAVATAKNILLA